MAVLPNGHVVVTDPWYSSADAQRVGAIYLFDADGVEISRITGTQEDDNIGGGRISVLANGHAVVTSPGWHNGNAAYAGAVTWIDAEIGASGVGSPENSLVGTAESDNVGGYDGVVPLSNGHYVVASSSWSNAGVSHVGAVTWANGNGSTVGPVTAGNSLVGTEPADRVGQDQNLWGSSIIALPNGHYVVPSWYWHGPSRTNYGAITWGNGEGGAVGPVSAANSLLGTTDCPSDIGAPSQITVLANSDYLVASPCWSNGTVEKVGAVTWARGDQPTAGEVSASNSLIGDEVFDRVGTARALALPNGNFVILSHQWHEGRGAATWGSGAQGGLSGVVSAANSLVGTTSGDHVGTRATILANGHYVIGSWEWSGPIASRVGSVTWANGDGSTVGPVTASNSMIGASQDDVIGFRGITALANGRYVVASPQWSNGSAAAIGAVTLLDGGGPTAGVVGPDNSMIGSQSNDRIGERGVSALPGGGFVVASPEWSHGSAIHAGAVTWGSGVPPFMGTVSAANSLVGSSAGDRVGDGGIRVLSGGDYVVGSDGWDRADLIDAGAVTWAAGAAGLSGAVSIDNSLVGAHAGASLGVLGPALGDGNYLVAGRSDPSASVTHTLSIVDDSHGASGFVQTWNTAAVSLGYSQFGTEVAYDTTRGQLVVGQDPYNRVTLFRADDGLFASGFETAQPIP